MERDKHKTYCVFRVFKDGDVIALFPLIYEGANKCCSYQHIGQHGSASLDLVAVTHPPRSCEEKAAVLDLKRELTQLGYNLDIHARMPPWRVIHASQALDRDGE